MLEGEVPAGRQFDQTEDVRDEEDNFYIAVDILRFSDAEKLPELPPLTRADLRDSNALLLPTPGRRHNDTRAFPSDLWNLEDNGDALELSRKGNLDMLYDSEELRQAVERSRRYKVDDLHQRLRQRFGKHQSRSRNELLAVCQEHVHEWHWTHTIPMVINPCELLADTIDFYTFLLSNEFMGSNLHTDIFPATFPAHLDQMQVTMPLAAVVEAIDRVQSENYHLRGTDATFAGGFSLATSTKVEVALMRIMPFDCGLTSRSRRCFLMPTYLQAKNVADVNIMRRSDRLKELRAGPQRGHHLLAVVQEEPQKDEESTHFEVTFYDSSARIFAGSELHLAAIVKRAVERLGWSTDRNLCDPEITYNRSNRAVQQSKGG